MSSVQAPPVNAEFKIPNHERVAETPQAVHSLEWPSTPGFFCRVETSTDLINWTRAKKPGGASGEDLGDISPEGTSTTAEVLVEGSNTRQFWRIKRLQPWDISP